MPRSVPVLDAFLYPRHVGFAPLPGVMANLLVHGTAALVAQGKAGGMVVWVFLASFLLIHAWMYLEYRRDAFCQYRWKAWVFPPDFSKGPTVTGPRRGLLKQRTVNLGGSCGRRYTV